MNQEKKSIEFSILVSDSFDRTDDRNAYEVSFRRWLVSQLELREMTVSEAIRKFSINPSSGPELIRAWRRKYSEDIIPKPIEMTEQEKQKLTELQKQLKAMEKQLEDARMRNIALSTLIDVAEEKLKINIRKKSGAKQ
jgi:transposase-like protein